MENNQIFGEEDAVCVHVVYVWIVHSEMAMEALGPEEGAGLPGRSSPAAAKGHGWSAWAKLDPAARLSYRSISDFFLFSR